MMHCALKTRSKILNCSRLQRYAQQKRIVSIDNTKLNRPIANWLLGTAMVVGGMVTVGGITRITRSGLSMVDWKPHGGLPPLNKEEWNIEFEKYKQFPEFKQRSDMTLGEFQGIYAWEYGHRMLGRCLGVIFCGPLLYFTIRKRIPNGMGNRLLTLLGLGATQGGIGWWMVKSGLETPKEKKHEIRVSPYRLATHLGLAFTTYSMLLWTAMDLYNPITRVSYARDMIDPFALRKIATVRKVGFVSAGLVGFTLLSGAFVAGTDAGQAYNTFPKMNDDWIPPNLLALKPTYRNFFENIPTVQLDHRILAMSTLTSIATMFGLARRRHVWLQLPVSVKTAISSTVVLAGCQVSLGIATLINCVPTDLAILHQAGAMGVLTSLLITLHSLRFAKRKIPNLQPVQF